MRAAFALARREARARAYLLLLGVAVGVMPVLSTELPGVNGTMRGPVAQMLLVLLTLVVAPLLGGTLITPELVSRRLGFYLSRPISYPALLGGKLLGALSLLMATQFLVIAPTALVDASVLAPPFALKRLLFAAGTLLVFALGLGASLVVRLRSFALVGDAVAAIAWGLLAVASVWRWEFALAVQATSKTARDQALVVGCTVAGLAWLTAAAIALARGGIDGKRVHRTLSALAWPAVMVLAIGLALVPARRLVASPAELDEVHPVFTGGGGWIAFSGRRGRFYCSFVVHPDSGRWMQIPVDPWGSYPFDFRLASAASRVVWLQSGQPWSIGSLRAERPAQIVAWDLDGAARPRASIPLAFRPDWMDISSDGTSALLFSDRKKTLQALDLASGAVTYEATWHSPPTGLFVSPSHFRSYARDQHGRRWSIDELDLIRGTWRRLGAIPLVWEDDELIGVTQGGGRVLVSEGPALALRDGRTGESLASLPIDRENWRSTTLLPNGETALLETVKGRLRARLGTAAGWQEPIDLGQEIPTETPCFAGSSPGPRQVYVTTHPRFAGPSHPKHAVLVDLERRTVEALPDGLVPPTIDHQRAGRFQYQAVSASAARVLADDPHGFYLFGHLFRVDLVTGERRRLAGR